MNLLSKSAAAFGGFKGVSGGVKAAAAIAAGRWMYNKWQANRMTRRDASEII